jgi:hypothetical protein
MVLARNCDSVFSESDQVLRVECQACDDCPNKQQTGVARACGAVKPNLSGLR